MSKGYIKLIIIVAIVAVLGVFVLSGCKSGLTVSFETFGGTQIESIGLNKGDTISKPTEPTKENFVFGGWYKDADYVEIFDFSTNLSKNLTLFTKWIPVAELFDFEVDDEDTISITGLKAKDEWIKEIIIPSSIDGKTVSAIAEDAFFNMQSLKRVSFEGETVKSISKYAFMHCINLVDIVLPNSIIEIEEGAFASCTALTEIAIPISVTTLGRAVFFGCKKLETIKGVLNADWDSEWKSGCSAIVAAP